MTTALTSMTRTTSRPHAILPRPASPPVTPRFSSAGLLESRDTRTKNWTKSLFRSWKLSPKRRSNPPKRTTRLETDEDGPFIYTVSAEVSDDAENEEDDAEDASEEDDGDEGDEEEEEEEEDEEEPQTEVQVVAGGGEGDDMLSFFNEAADAGAAPAAAWRQDLPDVSIEELLAEARAIRQQIEGKKRNTA